MAEEIQDFHNRQIENQQVGIDHWDGVAPDDDQGKRMQRQRTLYKLRRNEPGRREIEPPGYPDYTGGGGTSTAMIISKREKTGQTDRDVMLLEYGRLSDEGLSEEEIVNKIAEGFLPIGFDMEYWSGKVREVLEDTIPKMGQQQDPSRLDTYHFTQEYETGTTPVSRTDPVYRDNFIGTDTSHGTSPGVKIEKKDRKRKFNRRRRIQ